MSESALRNMKDLPREHLLAPGTAMCAGCGGLQSLHEVQDVLGRDTVVVNAAGCMTLLANYPSTPLPGSWLYTSMASAPAGAQAIRSAGSRNNRGSYTKALSAVWRLNSLTI